MLNNTHSNIKSSSSVPSNLLKIIVLGDSGVGKTALLYQYVENKFIQAYRATIGADLLTKVVTVENNKIQLQLWDTAGQERYDALSTGYYRGVDGCVFVYDITNKASLEHIDQWRQSFYKYATDTWTSELKFLLLGNKSDFGDDAQKRQVSRTEGEKYAETNNMLFFETSAVNGMNINQAFGALIHELIQTQKNPSSLFHFDPAPTIQLAQPHSDHNSSSRNVTCKCY
ncbi:hypothetical protein RFI_19246 [Reticulomyxa filosa]|uniref:Uncharacterized protein n=1 Tax=Reticulomyxa filosa TaxID=46433 RepID=X6MWM9_RETFI|nr:hypothetical protein RFI_19246 [Reticulomyxa filosa]|eukprot:ETO18051.1 hypothetical protein RFI_19246 [Reticulomyxa filosa]